MIRPGMLLSVAGHALALGALLILGDAASKPSPPVRIDLSVAAPSETPATVQPQEQRAVQPLTETVPAQTPTETVQQVVPETVTMVQPAPPEPAVQPQEVPPVEDVIVSQSAQEVPAVAPKPPPTPAKKPTPPRPVAKPRAETPPTPTLAPPTEQAYVPPAPPSPEPPRQVAVAPPAPPPPPPGVVGVPAAYRNAINQLLERYKEYPRAAERRGITGRVTVTFSIDRRGRLLAKEIVQSSGSSLLDDAMLALIDRVTPLPPVLPEMVGESFEFTVPMDFIPAR